METYCSTLEIPETATEEQIKQAYRLLVQFWHPDRFQHNPNLFSGFGSCAHPCTPDAPWDGNEDGTSRPPLFIAVLASVRWGARLSPLKLRQGYRPAVVGTTPGLSFDVHSTASRWASAIWPGVIRLARASRISAARFSPCAAEMLYHM